MLHNVQGPNSVLGGDPGCQWRRPEFWLFVYGRPSSGQSQETRLIHKSTIAVPDKVIVARATHSPSLSPAVYPRYTLFSNTLPACITLHAPLPSAPTQHKSQSLKGRRPLSRDPTPQSPPLSYEGHAVPNRAILVPLPQKRETGLFRAGNAGHSCHGNPCGRGSLLSTHLGCVYTSA
ncbi:hypothetical protein GWK47_039829 [Chionoecetes opilio]|uniref:Uncharacterized protein n=1 Tax=Chionoecetes opilio TaxID=41210 RepID=A0A8J5CLF9_CHIOP|nr:hypothetical protein GWK47_039829 [Chionoecetes opilio]